MLVQPIQSGCEMERGGLPVSTAQLEKALWLGSREGHKPVSYGACSFSMGMVKQQFFSLPGEQYGKF